MPDGPDEPEPDEAGPDEADDLVEADDDDSGRAVLLAVDELERQCVCHEGRQSAASTAETPASTTTTLVIFMVVVIQNKKIMRDKK